MIMILKISRKKIIEGNKEGIFLNADTLIKFILIEISLTACYYGKIYKQIILQSNN